MESHDVLAVAWRDALDRVESLAAVLTTVEELNMTKSRVGGWLATVDAISVRDHGVGLANLGSVDLGALHVKMLEQLKTAPGGSGVGGVTAVAAAVTPNDLEDGDGIPD